jgi:aquaporin Z
MSMNPARTVGSAVSAHVWTGLWIYFTAPLIGMITGAEFFVRLRGKQSVRCAKLHHQNRQRCIFRCGYASRTPASAKACNEGSAIETTWMAARH